MYHCVLYMCSDGSDLSFATLSSHGGEGGACLPISKKAENLLAISGEVGECGRLNPSPQVGTSRQFSRAKASKTSNISNI